MTVIVPVGCVGVCQLRIDSGAVSLSAVDIRLNGVNRGIVLLLEQSAYNGPPDSSVTTQKPRAKPGYLMVIPLKDP